MNNDYPHPIIAREGWVFLTLALVVALYLIDGYKLRTDMLSLDYTSQHTIALLSAMTATLRPSPLRRG